MHRNSSIIFAFIMAAAALGGLLVPGCQKRQPAIHHDTEAVSSETVFPSEGTFEKISAVADMSLKGQPSKVSTDNLGRLHISGIALVFVALTARFLFGSWKDAYIAAGLGSIPSVLAVLLTEYSRVVLLIPLCWIGILAFIAYQKLAEWRTKAKGFEAASTIIEKADTGSRSLGQLMKDRIAESGSDSVIDKALPYMEKLWGK